MLKEFVSRFRGAMSNGEIYHIMHDACRMLNIDYFIYALYTPNHQNKLQCYVSSNLVEEWDEAHAEALLRLNPSLRACLDSTMPVVWSTVAISKFPLRGSNAAMDLDSEFVISDGISLCVKIGCGGKGMVGLVVREGSILEYDVALLSSFLHIAAPYIVDKLNTQHRPAERRMFSLSKREMECLGWISAGKTSWEISRILGVSEKTVDFHVSNAVEKLDCKNRSQAVAKVVRYGLCEAESEYLFDRVHLRVNPKLHRSPMSQVT